MICRSDQALFRGLLAGIALILSGCVDEAGPPDTLQAAQTALADGDNVSADVILRRMLDNGVETPVIAAYLGESALLDGDLRRARRWLGSASFSEASQAHGYRMLGRLELAANDLPAAGRAFDRALALTPQDAAIWVDIGGLRYRGGEQAQAFEASRRAIALAPDDPVALRFHGQLIRDSNGMAAALPWFERGLESNPDDPDLLADYAATLGELGRAAEMLEAVRQLAKADPGNRQAFFLQAVLAARGDRFDLANTLLLRSGQVEDDVPAALLLSGIIELQRGNYAIAAQNLKRLNSAQPDNRRAALLLARALLADKRLGELEHDFAGVAARQSASPYMTSLIGRGYEVQGDRSKAAAALDAAGFGAQSTFSALKSGKTLAVAEMNQSGSGRDSLMMVRAGIGEGRAGAALEAAEAMVARFPGSGDALTLLGDARLAANQPTAALDAYEQAAQIRSGWPLTYKIAAVMTAQDQSPAAERRLRSALRGQPANSEAAALLAVKAAARGDWVQASAFAELAIVMGGDGDAALLTLAARAAIETGDAEAAVVFAEAAHDLAKMNGPAARVLADAYHAADVDVSIITSAEQKARMLGF